MTTEIKIKILISVVAVGIFLGSATLLVFHSLWYAGSKNETLIQNKDKLESCWGKKPEYSCEEKLYTFYFKKTANIHYEKASLRNFYTFVFFLISIPILIFGIAIHSP